MKILTQLLTLPGGGVHTVHTAKEKKERLFKAYYATPKLENAKKKWLKSMEKLDTKKPIIIGIPSDNGGGIQRGANWGPLAVRQELLNERKSFMDIGDVRVIPHLLHDKYLNTETIKACQKALYGRVNKLPVSPLSMTERAMIELYKKHPQARVLGIGGDHSVSYPLVKAWLRSRKNLKKAAVLHFDAHTDLLDNRLGIDLCFATWTFQVMENLASANHIYQIGIRSSGKNKTYWKKHTGVEQLWSKEANKLGAEKVLKKVISHFRKIGVEELYVSFDFDTLDEKYAGATGTPEKDGMLPSDCAVIIRNIAKEFKVTGADLMEVAPYVLPEGVSFRDQQSSLSVAGDMARILLEALET